MKVLVTGGAGYIGSVTTEMLLDAGHEVIVFDNFERGHRAAVDTRAGLITGDLRDQLAIENALRQTVPEVVMHFAAYALVGESMACPEKYFINNVKGGINLAEAMLKGGIKKIVFSSSCATYGQPDKLPITENTPQQPTNPYGESKLMYEKILNWLGQAYGLRCVFLRYFNACGASVKFGEDHNPETHLIPNIMRTALGRGSAFHIYGNDYNTPDGTCIRDYIHIEDLAKAHILALAENQTGAFNLGTGTGYSVLEILEKSRQITGINIPVKILPRRPGDPARLVADASKASSILGWRPIRSSLQDIISSSWAWHKKHPNGYGD
ncbi:MAG: UDP-glucose 4-epimerase GalE [Kiritimatiellia bacterium]|nr:UDP-glucose 4-epimerase GalE [Kiritimatiellia bacterium]